MLYGCVYVYTMRVCVKKSKRKIAFDAEIRDKYIIISYGMHVPNRWVYVEYL
jgi:hypothetical protein